MEGGQYRWSSEERSALIALRADGKTIAEVSERIGRSKKAISNYIKRHGLRCRGRRPNPPRPIEPPPELVSSDRLREAMLAALSRFANDNSLTEQEARAVLLGREPRGNVARIHPTGTDRTGYRPGEIVARPIGEIIKPIVARVLEGRG